MINKIVLMGRLTADPEMHVGNDMTYARFTIAVERNYKPKNGDKITDFINCTAWNGTAEFIDKYFHKGNMIAVSGELNIDRYEDKDGNPRTAANIRVAEVSFTGERNDTDEQPSNNKNTRSNNRRGYR